MKAGESLVDLMAPMTSTKASMVDSLVAPMDGFDGFDGGSDGSVGGSVGGIDGFDGLDGGGVGLAEADDSRVQK